MLEKFVCSFIVTILMFGVVTTVLAAAVHELPEIYTKKCKNCGHINSPKPHDGCKCKCHGSV